MARKSQFKYEGYASNILRVDLSNRKISSQSLTEELVKQFVGGRGINLKILYDEVSPGINPLSRENKIIIGAGPFVGTLAPSSGRFNITTKSALTGILGDSNSGGHWAPELKFAGYDHVAGRSGAGAVMGSKKLKAVAVRGTGKVQIAKSKEFRQANKEIAALLRSNPDFSYFQKTTSHYAHDAWVKHGCFPGYNFQTGEIPGWVETRGTEVALSYATKLEGVCYHCPFKCFKMGEVRNGKYAGLKISSVGFASSIYEFGAKIGIDNLPAIWKCKEVCHLMGLDYGSASGVIAFAMELYQRGILTKKESDGLPLNWGDDDVVLELLRKISYREGIGDILANGSVMAARIINRGAEKYAMTIKGMEMMWSDPRSAPKGWTLGYLINPRGGDNTKTTHSLRVESPTEGWGIEKFDMSQEARDKIYGVPPKIDPSGYRGKAMYVKWMSDICSAVSAAGGCIFSVTRLGMGPTYFSRLVTAATGWDITPEEFAIIGERIFNLMRLYIGREGLSRKDDDFPDRFYSEPMPEGPAKGAKLSRKDINQFLDESYRLQGWDRNGIPTTEKLIEIGLEEEGKLIGIV